MHIYVVFAHPSHQSFTHEVLEAFLRGLDEGGHTHELGDLYTMDFKTDMDLDEYMRETGGDAAAPLPADVVAEHQKIERADGLGFVYPVWWSDCPAKLKGWFDRVLSYGYAYIYDDGEHRTSRIEIGKAVVICPAGHSIDHLDEIGIADAMRRVMVDDRLLGVGIKTAHMEILGGMVPGDAKVREGNLDRARELGRDF